MKSCEKCNQKPATVLHLQVVNGAKTELQLCQECFAQLETPMPGNLSIEGLLNNLLGSILHMTSEQQSQASKKYAPCAVCGMTYEGFKDGGGKLGCEACYKVFARELEALLKNVQASIRHEGKFPQKSGKSMFQKREVARLRGLIRKAIEDENFEEAARLRDEIRTLEANLAESKEASAL